MLNIPRGVWARGGVKYYNSAFLGIATVIQITLISTSIISLQQAGFCKDRGAAPLYSVSLMSPEQKVLFRANAKSTANIANMCII